MRATNGTLNSMMVALMLIHSSVALSQQAPRPRPIEAYPDRILAARENHRRQLQAAGSSSAGMVPFYLIVPRVQRWQPGRVLRVAFNGGTAELHEKIRTAAVAWTQSGGANLQLSFHDAQGRFRRWTANDTQYAAEIRIAFLTGADYGGFWSAVGTDSIAASAGEAPNVPSMNLEGFDVELPQDWQAVVVHEFGHALGFEHEHQSPAGGCDFRFDDDPDYQLTKDASGWYTNDANGRRPGMYTYLGGHANYWPAERVNRNLRALQTSSAFLVGAFDRDSIMKYFFPAFMFIAGEQSLCFTPTDNRVLSQMDLAGARAAYPRNPASIATINSDAARVLQQIRGAPSVALTIRNDAADRLKNEHNL